MLSSDTQPELDQTAGLVRYRRHKPEETTLYPIIVQHLPQFLSHLAEQGTRLPRFVTQEFGDYVACSRLEFGFLRVKCNGCRHELLVAFSCKNRGFCPSCGARRMIETSAHLIDHVIPPVPTRHVGVPPSVGFVFSLAIALSLCQPSRRAHANTWSDYPSYRNRPHPPCWTHTSKRRQIRHRHANTTLRIGSQLEYLPGQIHLHMIALDGAYTFDDNTARFHSVKAPSSADMYALLNRIIHRTVSQLERDGVLIQDTEQPYFDFSETDIQDTFNAASVRYRIAIGPNSGKKILTIRSQSLIRTQPKPFTVNRDGFSLNASVSCQPQQRDRLERLCRYITRAPLALERLSTRDTGEVVYELKHPFNDGTTHFVFEPMEFLAKLAALVPRPRANLTRYHGVLAPNAKYRNLVVPTPRRSQRKIRTRTIFNGCYRFFVVVVG